MKQVVFSKMCPCVIHHPWQKATSTQTGNSYCKVIELCSKDDPMPPVQGSFKAEWMKSISTHRPKVRRVARLANSVA